MKKTLLIDFFRSVKGTLSRFLSILVMVALGVGFYTGLKAVSPDMVSAAGAFYTARRLADIVLISTIGFDEADAAAVREIPGVASVTAQLAADGLLYDAEGAPLQSLTGTAYVLRVFGYDFAEPPPLNTLRLVTGRMPQDAGECVVTEREAQANPDIYSIGKDLILRGDGEDLLTVLQTETYRIVGTVESADFLSAELGASQAGAGELSGYIYIPKEAFLRTDAVYLLASAEGAAAYTAYTEEYNAVVAEVMERIEASSGNLVKARAARLEAEYKPLLSAGWEELPLKRKEAEAGLAQAREDLKGLKQAIADGPAEYKAQETAARAELEAKKQELADGTRLYKEKKAEYDKGKAAYDAAQKEIAAFLKEHPEPESELAMAKEEYQKGAAALEKASSALTLAKNALKVARAALSSGLPEKINSAVTLLKQYFPIGDMPLTLEEAKEKITAAETSLAEKEADLTAQQKALADAQKQIEEAESKLAQYAEFQTAGEQLAAAEAELKAAAAQLEQAPALLAEAEAELERKLAEARQQLAQLQTLALTADSRYANKEKEIRDRLAAAERELVRGENLIKSLPTAKWQVSSRDAFAGYANYGDTAVNMEAFALVFPVIFFLIAALVSLTTMTRMVEDERGQQGVLKACGYAAPAIGAKYLLYALSAAALGSLLGAVLGFSAIPPAIFRAYQLLYLIPEMEVHFYSGYALTALGAAVLSTVGAVVFSVLRALRERPASLMRPKAPKAGKAVFLESFPVIWRNLGFSGKVTVRNLLRSKKRFMMTFAGVAGCTALLLTGFGIGASIRTMLDEQFGEDGIMRFDGQALLAGQPEGVDFTVPALPEGITETLPIYMQNLDISSAEHPRTMEATLIVPERTDNLRSFIALDDDKTGAMLSFKGEGVYIDGKTAEVLKLSVGDSLRIAWGGSALEIPVTSISRNYVYHYIYMTREAFAAASGSSAAAPNCLLLKLEAAHREDGESKAALSRSLTDTAEISAVVWNSTVIAEVRGMANMLSGVVMAVFTVSAGLLAFVVLYNLNNINIYERLRELATIKVLGFTDGEADMYIWRENIILTLLGIGAGLLFGVPLHGFVIRSAEIESMMFVRTLAPVNFALAAAVAAGFAVFVNALAHRRIKGIDMVGALKSVE
ncbi:MAG: hypothetical protein LBR73_06690 [Oscillospiraceae bacterium]|jgi:putative ABC transport system permease protein|nr:hypothetical protein [Oscillospiraceae bacterium]